MNLGSPIQLTGVALDLHVQDGYAWIAENAAVVRKIDLEVRAWLVLACAHQSLHA